MFKLYLRRLCVFIYHAMKIQGQLALYEKVIIQISHSDSHWSQVDQTLQGLITPGPAESIYDVQKCPSSVKWLNTFNKQCTY